MQIEHEKLLQISLQLAALGLNKGTSGNASVRYKNGFLVTPSGVAASELTIKSLVEMQFDGSHEPDKKPSSEWFFHRDILQSRPEINAVIHTHSMFATTLACLQLSIPAFHYMIAVAGGDTVNCAPYALFGTESLSHNALKALQNRKACLLAHHGMIALGRDCEEALNVAIEVENLSEQYWRILQVNPNPPLLNHAEMEQVFQQFKGYGKWAR